jgi:hypothetical protein
VFQSNCRCRYAAKRLHLARYIDSYIDSFEVQIIAFFEKIKILLWLLEFEPRSPRPQRGIFTIRKLGSFPGRAVGPCRPLTHWPSDQPNSLHRPSDAKQRGSVA